MERLQQAGIAFALLLTAGIVISLFAGFQALIGQPVAFFGAILLSVIMVWIILKVALVPERRHTGWVSSITGPNGRWLFLVLLIVWGAAMAFLAAQGFGPQQVGAPALVGLFVGIFLFMGFIWAVIGE